MAPKALKKQLVEALILSKVDYNDIVVYPHRSTLKQNYIEFKKSAASFVKNRYAKMDDVIIPVKEQTKIHLLRTTHRALCDTSWPSYLTLQRHKDARVLHRNWLCLLKQEHFKIQPLNLKI